MRELISMIVADNLVWGIGGFFCGVVCVGVPWIVREMRLEDKKPDYAAFF
jgi:hypothetical protein